MSNTFSKKTEIFLIKRYFKCLQKNEERVSQITLWNSLEGFSFWWQVIHDRFDTLYLLTDFNLSHGHFYLHDKLSWLCFPSDLNDTAPALTPQLCDPRRPTAVSLWYMTDDSHGRGASNSPTNTPAGTFALNNAPFFGTLERVDLYLHECLHKVRIQKDG